MSERDGHLDDGEAELVEAQRHLSRSMGALEDARLSFERAGDSGLATYCTNRLTRLRQQFELLAGLIRKTHGTKRDD